MKWRQTLGYLLILLAVGGYYYYFEVVVKEREEAAARSARRVFDLEVDRVAALEIVPKDGETVVLEKEAGTWRLAAPVATEADGAAVQGLLNSLASLEAEREVASSAEDLEPFGLSTPALQLRFKDGETWRTLSLGNRNPTGDSYYARVDAERRVFLVASGQWGVLHKGVSELRRRDLFSFENSDVKELRVSWSDGREVAVVRSSGGAWEVSGRSEPAIKAAKVERVLDEIRWLRARDFLEDGPVNLPAHGLDPPLVKVELHLSDGGRASLALGRKGDEGDLAALGSELPFVVTVSGDLLDRLPDSLADIEDRSLIALDAERVNEVAWTVAGETGRAVSRGETGWALEKAGGEFKELNDSWRIRSLFWELQDLEFDEKPASPPPVPDPVHGRLALFEGAEPLGELLWEDPERQGADQVTVWVREGSELKAVGLEPEKLRRLEEKIRAVTAAES